MQSVLFKSHLFARGRADHTAIFAEPENGARGRTAPQRSLQRHRGGDGSRLFESQSFQQSILRDDWLLPGALSGGEERDSRAVTRVTLKKLKELHRYNI